jgi:hypothetical protein
MHDVRSLVPVAFLLALFALPGQTQEKKRVIYDSLYYPLRVGNEWTYKVTTGDIVKKVVVTVDHNELYDHKFTQDKKEATETIVRYRLKVVSESKVLEEHVAPLKDGVYRFTTAGKDIAPPLRFLNKLPAAETWTVESTSENVPLKGTFSSGEETVKVPAGQFTAWRVSAQTFQFGAEKMSLDTWYAPDIGMVKQKVRVANSEVLMELEQFKAGK